MYAQFTRPTTPTPAWQQYRLINDIYVLLNTSDRRVLRPFNLTTSQYAMLLLLDTSKGHHLTELSEHMLCDKSTITRIADRLEQAGLIRRIPDPDDRRAQNVILTPSGEELRARALSAHEQSLKHYLEALNETEQRQLSSLLDKLRAGLHAELESNGVEE